MPWPEEEVSLAKMGCPEPVAACRRAVILREFAGLTRPSVSPARKKTAGYLVPSMTWW